MSRRQTRDDVDRFHDYGIHIPSRTIYIGSESSDELGESGVDALMADKLIKNIRILDSISEENITIIMNNPGGDWYHGIAIYDAIAACRSYITIHIYGHAMSMGSVILQAADRRVMSPNAEQMVHYGYTSFAGESKTYLKMANQEKKLNSKMEKIYLDRIRSKKPDYTLKQLRVLLDRDSFLGAEESIELGLADEILGVESAEEEA